MPPSLPDDYSRYQSPAPQPTLLRVGFSNVKFEQNNIRSKPFQGSPWYCRKKPSSLPFHAPWSLTHLPPGLIWLLRHAGLQAFTLLSLLPCCSLSIFLHSESFPGHKSSWYFPQQHLTCFITMHLAFSLLPALPPQYQNVCFRRAGTFSLSIMASSLIPSAVSGIQCGLTCLLNEYIKWPQVTPFHNKAPMCSICSLAHFHTIVLKTSENGAGTPAPPPTPPQS